MQLYTVKLKERQYTGKLGKIQYSNMNHNKGGVVILTPDKVDFRTRNITREPQRYFITIRKSIHQRSNSPKCECT